MRAASVIASFLIGAVCATAVGRVDAGINPAQVKNVEAAPAPNAALPLDLGFVDRAGHSLTLRDAISGLPSVLVFVDYTCRTLCGPILDFVAAGLAKTGLRPGTDYRLVVIGIDPRDKPAAAQAMSAAHIGDDSPLGQAARFLTGDAAAISLVTRSAGLTYEYDAQHDQYAHPAAVYVVDGSGRIRRVLSPLGLDGSDLRLAIVDAGQGAIGTLADRIHLLCYGYDPVKGIYTERITTMLAASAGLTLLILFAGISLMAVREKRSKLS